MPSNLIKLSLWQMAGLYKDPDGKNVSMRTRTTTLGSEIYTSRAKIKNLEKVMMEKDVSTVCHHSCNLETWSSPLRE